MNFKVSEFCHFVDGKNNLVALYNALTLGIVILDKETAKILQEAKGGIISVKIIDLSGKKVMLQGISSLVAIVVMAGNSVFVLAEGVVIGVASGKFFDRFD